MAPTRLQVASIALALWSGAAAAQAPSPDVRGIFAYSAVPPASDATLTAALGTAGVDGLSIVVDWDAIEPAAGIYQWMRPSDPQSLDQWIGAAIKAGKKVELSVRSDKTPGWLAAAGVKTASFTYNLQSGDKICRTETIAVPWDPGFLAQWDAMLAALSGHLKATVVNGKSEYEAVSLLRLTGMDRNSDELHLPAEAADAACGKDTIRTWQSLGYKPSLLLQGWDAITTSFKKNFPDKDFSVAIIASTYPFPPIAESGAVITKLRDLGTTQNEPLMKLASQKFPGHLVIQNNSLYEDVVAQPETVEFATSLKSMIAFQTNFVLGAQGGAACSSRATKNNACATSNDFLSLLQTGIYPKVADDPKSLLRAQYIEVFAPNIVAFPDAIQKAHDELVAPPLTAPPNTAKIASCPHGQRFCN